MLSQSTALSSIGYQIGQTIGEGGNAKVKIGIKIDTNEPVAIKVVKKISGPQGQQIMTNLLKEVKIHSSVSHKNIIELFTTTEDNSFVYLIMEFAHSGELFDRIAPDVGIEEDLCHLFFQQLLSGMQYCHEHGIAHRDLKPENLLLDVHGNLKIIDFGLATVFKHKGVTRYISYSKKQNINYTLWIASIC
jgi:serine/threonine-protein kinase Chk1